MGAGHLAKLEPRQSREIGFYEAVRALLENFPEKYAHVGRKLTRRAARAACAALRFPSWCRSLRSLRTEGGRPDGGVRPDGDGGRGDGGRRRPHGGGGGRAEQPWLDGAEGVGAGGPVGKLGGEGSNRRDVAARRRTLSSAPCPKQSGLPVREQPPMPFKARPSNACWSTCGRACGSDAGAPRQSAKEPRGSAAVRSQRSERHQDEKPLEHRGKRAIRPVLFRLGPAAGQTFGTTRKQLATRGAALTRRPSLP